MTGAFDGIKVLEFADFIAGPYCTKLITDLGAEAVKIEAPCVGDSARRFGPFPGDDPHPERSGLYLFLNSGKRSITLDPSLPTGLNFFTRLVSRADVLVESSPPRTMDRMGLGYDSLKQINPGLVYVSITPYGQEGPKAHWKAHHINSFHASGEGYTLPGGLGYKMYPDRGPITAGAHLGEYDAGLTAACATVAALYAREFLGVGQHVDVSKQEATMSLYALTHAQYLGEGRLIDRSRGYDYGGIFPCKDGYVILYPREDRHWKAVTETMGRPELAEDERYITRAARIQNAGEVNEYLGDWALGLSKEEIYYLLAPSGCPAAFFATARDVLASPQLKDREFFVDIDHPEGGPLSYPSRPYRFTGSSWDVKGPAPSLGQHNEQVYCDELGIPREELAGLRRGGVV